MKNTTNANNTAAEALALSLENLFINIETFIENRTTRSAWSHGVEAYALDLLEDIKESINYDPANLADLASHRTLERLALNGAGSWNQYSRGGCSLIYNYDIAARLCNPSELKRTDNGRKRPNSQEEWLDTQARALYQAHNILQKAVKANAEQVNKLVDYLETLEESDEENTAKTAWPTHNTTHTGRSPAPLQPE